MAVKFTVEDVEYELPVFTLTSGEMRKLRNLSNIDALYTLLEMRGDPKLVEASDKLPFTEAAALFTEWMQGLRLGESSGSSI